MPSFAAATFDINYLEHAGGRLLGEPVSESLLRPIAVVAALLAEERRTGGSALATSAPPPGRTSAWLVEARRESLQ